MVTLKHVLYYLMWIIVGGFISILFFLILGLIVWGFILLMQFSVIIGMLSLVFFIGVVLGTFIVFHPESPFWLELAEKKYQASLKEPYEPH